MGCRLLYKDAVAGTVSSGATKDIAKDVNDYYESDAVSIYSSLAGAKARELFALAKAGGADLRFTDPDPATEPVAVVPVATASGTGTATRHRERAREGRGRAGRAASRVRVRLRIRHRLAVRLRLGRESGQR